MKAEAVWIAAKKIDRRHMAIATEAQSISMKSDLDPVVLATYGKMLDKDLNGSATDEMAQMGLTRLVIMGVAQEEDLV